LADEIGRWRYQRRSGGEGLERKPITSSSYPIFRSSVGHLPVGCCNFAITPLPRHSHAMQTTVELDASNRIVLSRELRRAAGIPRKQRLMVSATPGRIVLEIEANVSGRLIKRGKLKVWTGAVPATPIEQAVEQSRHYTR